MKFITALAGVCQGTSVFIKLLRQSLLKTFLHLLLLTFICSLFISVVKSVKLSDRINAAVTVIQEKCGDIKITDKGILPSVKPDQVKLFAVPGGFSVCYLPLGYKGKLPDIDEDNIDRGIIWTPGIIATWMKTKNDSYMMLPNIYYKLEDALQAREFQKDEIIPYLKKNGKVVGSLNLPYNKLSPEKFRTLFKILAGIMLFIIFFFQILFQAILFISIFSLIFSLIGGRRIKVLKLRDLFVIAAYAGFPAMIIGSLFPALELPLLDYNTVYLFGFTGYLMFIINRIERQLAPPPEMEVNQ
jgi:hypothetical protein